MAALQRTEAAGFSLAEAHTIEELSSMTEEELLSLVIPVEQLFSTAPAVTVKDFHSHLLRNGQALEQKKLQVSYPADTYLRLYDHEGFFALGTVPSTHPDCIKVLTLFRL